VRKLVACKTTTSSPPRHVRDVTLDEKQSGGALAPPLRYSPTIARRNERAPAFAYWTVIVPFIPIARCGVQWNGYWPGFTLANEIV
jgi:hypothetical protein